MQVRALVFISLVALRSWGIDLMNPAKLAQYKAILPRVEDAQLSTLLESPDTLWYDGESIVPGYQDSMLSPKGFRPNTIEPILIDLAVPGGWKTLFAKSGRFNFPFGTGGADLCDTLVKINFWAPPKNGGQTLPVAYWVTNFTRWRWLFPVGTVIGEVLIQKFTDGDLRVFEIRTRKRELTGWKNAIYRPFPNAWDLIDGIKMHRMNWYEKPNLKNMISFLLNDETLVPRTLSSKNFPISFESSSGQLDSLPDLQDPILVKELLLETPFRSVTANTVWKSGKRGTTFAPGTSVHNSIIPKDYDGGMLRVEDQSCNRCHKDAGRGIGEYHDSLVAYGELWGEDEIFSWHPFETSMFVNSDGTVANFNNDNRRLRKDFLNAGLVVQQTPSNLPDSLYREIPHDWTYHPIRK